MVSRNLDLCGSDLNKSICFAQDVTSKVHFLNIMSCNILPFQMHFLSFEMRANSGTIADAFRIIVFITLKSPITGSNFLIEPT